MSDLILSEELIEQIKKVTNKRPRQVLEHIVKHGKITTEELKDLYGYNHPPRAARDVREAGIPLKTTRVTSSDGRSIGAYELDVLTNVTHHKLNGRKVFSKDFKKLLCVDGSTCAVCNTEYPERYLQIDHRIPYEVAGDQIGSEENPLLFMLLCGTCNTIKNYSCKNCENWINNKDIETCKTCYWGSPSDYKHIALKRIKRLDLVWTEDEVTLFEIVQLEAVEKKISLQELIKSKLTKP